MGLLWAIYNATVVEDGLLSLLNVIFIHMGVIVNPCEYFLYTYPLHYILLRRTVVASVHSGVVICSNVVNQNINLQM